ncbi:signal peptidase II [Lachnospiraceae bacterium PF1-21]|nr:signal peptidase II [Ohessyouella blattaphilus]
MEKNSRIKYYLISCLGLAALVALDQLTKVLAVHFLKDKAPVVLIDNVLEFYYLENSGAAFGILQGKIIFFLISFIVVIFLFVMFARRVPLTKQFLPLRACILFIMAGALGNMIDRLRFQYVIDFIYFKLIDFPIFNVADIYVTVSVIVLVLLIFFYYKEDDLEKILHSSRK